MGALKESPLLGLPVPRVFAGKASSDSLNVLLCNLLGFLQLGENGEFGADQAAQAAINAIISLEYQFRWMVTLFIEPLALLEAPVGAEFDAKTAALAPLLNYANHALGYRVSLRIQRKSPKFHPNELRRNKV
jgi:hypothetical protein